ncbi:L,D-transpeptidase family protein [Hoeflea prorocentri]|uniref:L,D-transpeptidase family protein n=1 Tax=Hoeflea prorocentri TaxID=1922333 RepID=A0A9X3ZHX8_9HYPH|nr:L,D-transpeptidase family protein [Hoeflea prorocentri]MCY6381388.1 L,D-transpeptidase family protein [Hoeflea prorocentri]MDA5399188.1 L,D-transpeptidase family protein [Hoeflea prorocentri]
MRILSFPRLVLPLILATALSGASTFPAQASKGTADAVEETKVLPKARPERPVLMLVSIDNQTMRVFAGSELVYRSDVSTGKPGNDTPTGIFSVLEKRRYHESNIYSQAPMPFMQRLTWSGIALHESGDVPDYPASHGCVRLPAGFAKKLFGFTGIGAHVLIADDEVSPRPISHDKLFYPGGRPADIANPAASVVSATVKPMQRKDSGSLLTFGEPQEDVAANPIGVSLPVSDGYVMRTGFDPSLTPVGEDDGFEFPQSKEPIRILVTQRTGRELVRDIQMMLNQLGFDAGEADGLIGADTGAAILRYQKSRGEQPTGAVSVALARQLHLDTGRGAFSTGHIYVRQGFKPLFDAPVFLNDAEQPLGTHFLTALPHRDEQERLQWVYVTLSDNISASALLDIKESYGYRTTTAQSALNRIVMPQYVRKRLTTMMVPGSSLVITDGGLSSESHKGTDFIVLTD